MDRGAKDAAAAHGKDAASVFELWKEEIEQETKGVLEDGTLAAVAASLPISLGVYF